MFWFSHIILGPMDAVPLFFKTYKNIKQIIKSLISSEKIIGIRPFMI